MRLAQHPTAMVLVWDRNKLLLAQRARAPERGSWAPPAGHVERNETARAAAVRECDEEVGRGAIRVGRELFAFTHDIKLGHRHDAHVFEGALKDPKRLRAGSDAAAIRWCTLAELARLEAAKRIELTHYAKQTLNRLAHGRIKTRRLSGRWQ